MKIKKLFSKIVLISCVIACVSFLLLNYEMHQFEEGILSVAASSQDGYVQLVLDQINLKENRDDEEIITNILSTLDASSNRYWAFTKDETIVFVKDVLETNRYKDLTTSTYYNSDSSKAFYQSLKQGSVQHQMIELNDRTYIASGAAFNYNGTQYRLVLLSNREAILDNNDYLHGKIELYIMYYGTVLILLVMACVLSWKYDRQMLGNIEARKEVEERNVSLVKLNEQLVNKESNAASKKVWNILSISTFAKAFAKRNISKGIVVQLQFQTIKDKEKFIEQNLALLPEDVICFEKEEKTLVLLSIYETVEQLKSYVSDEYYHASFYTMRFNRDEEKDHAASKE